MDYKHSIQYDPDYDLFVLYRLLDGQKIEITRLSDNDLQRISKKYAFYKGQRNIQNKILENRIKKEKEFIDILISTLGETDTTKKLINEAWERISYYTKVISEDNTRILK